MITCTIYIGEKYDPEKAEATLRAGIKYMIEKKHVDTFLVGNDELDKIAQNILELDYRHILYVIFPKDMYYLKDEVTETDKKLKGSEYNKAIRKRNDELLKTSHYLMLYSDKNDDEIMRLKKKAMKSGVFIIAPTRDLPLAQ